MSRTESRITDHGTPDVLCLRRGGPPTTLVEMVIAKDGETMVFQIPYLTLLSIVAEGANFLRSRADLFKPQETK